MLLKIIVCKFAYLKLWIMAYDVIDIANKLLYLANFDDGGELMTNLKLQKMLYCEQGFHLAKFNTPLFDAEIEAWMYGPAVPEVYEHFKKYGRNGIPPETETPIALTTEEEGLFWEVFNAYADFSAYGLMKETHKELPWRATTTGVGNVIPKSLIRDFFKTQLLNES